MKKRVKKLVMLMVMMLGCFMMSSSVSAMEAPYTVPTCSDISKLPGKAKSYKFKQDEDIVIPLTLKKGVAYFGYQCKSGENDLTGSVYLYLYKDKALTDMVDNSAAGQGEDNTECYRIEKTGTYYLYVENDCLDGATLTLSMSSLTADNRTITSGKSTSFANSKKYVYTKFKAKKNGFIEVDVKGFSNMHDVSIKLLNNKKKALSKTEVLSGYDCVKGEKVCYGVQKGKTYYIATRCENLYSIKVKFTSVSGKTASKAKKAIKMTKKKTYKGVMYANGKRSDVHYYKFVLKKKGKLRIKVGTKGFGNLRIYVYTKYQGQEYGLLGGLIYPNAHTFRDYPAGTYYIKISKMDKYSNGYYSLKWY